MSEAKIISRAADCNVGKFMQCQYDQEYSVLIVSGEPTPEQLFEAWDKIITEFIDASGQFKEMEEMELLRRKEYLENRNMAIEMTIMAQRVSVDKLGMPMIDDFEVLEMNGYRPRWNGDKNKFLLQLDGFAASEASFNSEYISVCKEIEDYYKELEKSNGKKLILSRIKFLQMVNTLEKFGYRVDFETTSSERFAIMISDYKEFCAQSEFKKLEN